MAGTVTVVHNEHPNTFNTWGTGKKEDAAGNYVDILVWDGATVRYCHMLQNIVVSPGQYVNAGTVIGYVGDTGNSKGAHLHFQVNNGKHVTKYLP